MQLDTPTLQWQAQGKNWLHVTENHIDFTLMSEVVETKNIPDHAEKQSV